MNLLQPDSTPHRIVTFGEVMMRLQPPHHARLDQTRSLDVVYGGGEANVAIALAHLGVPASHVTRFPDNSLGLGALKFLREHLVDTSHVLLGGTRLGLYFLEKGVAMRAGRLVYDRADSAFAHIRPGMIDWATVLRGATWFHWAGITPALSAGAAAVCLEAVQVAKQLGLTVSADVFYRSNLWQWGKTPQEVLPELTRYADLVIADAETLQTVYQLPGPTFADAAPQLQTRFPAVRRVVCTQRESLSASHHRLGAMAWNSHELLTATPIDIDPIVDRIGGGDAFIAGLIYSLMQGETEAAGLAFGLAASALKHTLEGDANTVDRVTIEAVRQGDLSGRLRR